MEQQFSTSKVTVEYFDPHDVYKLLSPGLTPRLPLRNLHWQSHAGPLRSIDTLNVELIQGGDDAVPVAPLSLAQQSSSTLTDDGFQTQNIGGRPGSTDTVDTQSLPSKAGGGQRRHQIPGLRRTPYLKVLFVRCDDNDSYKNTVRNEIRDWIKENTTTTVGSKKSTKQENHDAFEYLIVHVVLPNTVAATQPRSTASKSENLDKPSSTSTSRWRSGPTPLMEKLRSDFNAPGKGSVDHIAQIRIGINDVPYDMLPRVVPAVPSGYSEDERDAEAAWGELVARLKSLILTSFDMRVSQYEEDIKEKDAQRTLPGWNFCTFFILKEGLARGFENVGLVEDALVGYDELSVGLDSVLQEQAQPGFLERNGGAMLSYTDELKEEAQKALAEVLGDDDDDDEEAVDLQSKETTKDRGDDIMISTTKKPYRDMILANNVSVFDFRCYIFSRQIAVLLRLANATASRDELLAKLEDQEASVLRAVSPTAPTHSQNGTENMALLAEICRRTLQFIPAISQIMRRDVAAGMAQGKADQKNDNPYLDEVLDNMVASFAFSVAQQILAQTSTQALPMPPSTLVSPEESKMSIPEPKTMMHPARNSSMHLALSSAPSSTRGPPPSPGVFPGPGMTDLDAHASVLKTGLEELAARRAELYVLSRSILDRLGKKRGWSDGWDEAPIVGDADIMEMQEISLDDESDVPKEQPETAAPSMAGVQSHLLRIAIDSRDSFYRLYEILTDKALRHYTVANQDHAVQANMADLAVLKVHLKDYKAAASYFFCTTPFFGESGWSMLELSMLIMYSRCLSELDSKDEFVRVTLKLLTKACAAEAERLRQKSTVLFKDGKTSIPDLSSIRGIVAQLYDHVRSLATEAKVPLANFFTRLELTGPPLYREGRDSCSLTFKLWSLLPEEITIDRIYMKMTSVGGGPSKEVAFDQKKEVVLKPGRNTVTVECNSTVPGKYRISHLDFRSSKLYLFFDRDASQPPPVTADIFRHADITMYQRRGGMDVGLVATKHTALDKNNSLDLELSTGWNSLKSCEIRVKPATGGLRLLTTEACIVDSSVDFARPPEAGVFVLGSMPVDTSLTIRFPYSVESDVVDVLARLEISYVTDSNEPFYLAKALAIPISLVLGVNVQDVFKHQAIFSRFTVSAATPSPLRLYKSELLDSELFQSSFGVPPQHMIMVFPKQPATLLYKITRKHGARGGKRTSKTMHLRLHYSLLQTEAEEAIKASISEALEHAGLGQYSRVLLEHAMAEVANGLQPQDLERAALLGHVNTAFLVNVSWARYFHGMGTVPGSSEYVATRLSTFLKDWQTSHTHIPLPTAPIAEPSSILIPVEVPSLPIVHTADLRLHPPALGTTPTVVVNQMLPATLHLKWTRSWDTNLSARDDQEFSYEVTAPADTWLLGGRRKGHFVIPAAQGDAGLSSTPETEAEIPLVLIPLREGYLPYPTIDIREVPADGVVDDALMPLCEVDWRNLGETVRVLGNTKSITVSLDASGAAGGPLVLESERLQDGAESQIVA
ncbi:hypothetical protein S40285_05810 [Stachybotrys chlorohalonatus IBT 40285]|uniref:Trafficking protein particle complex subunit 10 n=1 Tax=Stachybotrys chlorohalonatus (strain IBT 40285) TaxID=1283841 RepID=A0A084QF47_STAC4|nr:hypothetical protein S40285_05810 [Stachybotrys chlorohalonata IBT 40285]